MNQSKLLFAALLVLILLFVLPICALAAYHQDDIDAMVKIANDIGLVLDGNPANWPVTWQSPSSGFDDRIIGLYLYGMSGLTGSLDLNTQGIGTGTGLDALVHLSCSQTGITALVGHNSALQMLECYNTGITALDPSQYPALTHLTCFGTGITALDVSSNPALMHLQCHDTNIMALDVGNNPALANLDCHNTGITALDVSNNPALASLDCHNTGIAALDVSQNLALNGLNCSNTGITALDVGNNPALQVIYCFSTYITTLDMSQNLAMVVLNCSNTGITALDVSNNLQLMELRCNNAQLAMLNLSGCVNLIPFGFTIGGNPLINLITPEGHTIQVDHVGNGTAYIENYLLTSKTVHFAAVPDSGWNFNQWQPISPSGLTLSTDPTYLNGITIVALQSSYVRAVFVRPSSPTPSRLPSKLPKTGDHFPMGGLLALMVVNLVALGWVEFWIQRKRSQV